MERIMGASNRDARTYVICNRNASFKARTRSIINYNTQSITASKCHVFSLTTSAVPRGFVRQTDVDRGAERKEGHSRRNSNFTVSQEGRGKQNVRVRRVSRRTDRHVGKITGPFGARPVSSIIRCGIADNVPATRQWSKYSNRRVIACLG